MPLLFIDSIGNVMSVSSLIIGGGVTLSHRGNNVWALGDLSRISNPVTAEVTVTAFAGTVTKDVTRELDGGTQVITYTRYPEITVEVTNEVSKEATRVVTKHEATVEYTTTKERTRTAEITKEVTHTKEVIRPCPSIDKMGIVGYYDGMLQACPSCQTSSYNAWAGKFGRHTGACAWTAYRYSYDFTYNINGKQLYVSDLSSVGTRIYFDKSMGRWVMTIWCVISAGSSYCKIWEGFKSGPTPLGRYFWSGGIDTTTFLDVALTS